MWKYDNLVVIHIQPKDTEECKDRVSFLVPEENTFYLYILKGTDFQISYEKSVIHQRFDHLL